MKTYHLLMLGGAMLAAAPLQAQVSGVAIADPEAVILQAKALDAANASISTTFKADLDKASARQQALRTELNTLYAPLDLNKDKQLDDSELAAAQAAKNPALARIDAAQKSAQADIARFNGPATRAQAWAIEQIAQKYGAAMKTVVDSKKINLLLGAGSVQFASPAADVTSAVKAELDRTTPTVTITPPANWQPGQQTVQLQQQYQQLVYLSALQQQRQAQAGGAPATPSAAPARPATTPTRPPAGR